jgi:carbamoyl-phosphate synthase large subunit
LDTDFNKAFAKSQLAAYQKLPTKGMVFVSVKDADKNPAIVIVAEKLRQLGFEIISTMGTARYLDGRKVYVRTIKRVSQGQPNLIDLIREDKVQMVINTASGKIPRQDEIKIRSTAVSFGIPVVTTLQGAEACVRGVEALIKHRIGVKPIQGYQKKNKSR